MNQLESMKNALLESGQVVKAMIADEQDDCNWQNFSKELCRLLARCINKGGVDDELEFLLENLDWSSKKMISKDSDQRLSELNIRYDELSHNEKIQLCFKAIKRIDDHFLKRSDTVPHLVANESTQFVPAFSQVG
ncbi:hypothetical protein LJC64_04700 [Ruminococcaceae bacterium OttesenSCG-928-A11]|nr:hypothetical protein [Ruminococcaceae bacterium OttesenSCG-928-A11]